MAKNLTATEYAKVIAEAEKEFETLLSKSANPAAETVSTSEPTSAPLTKAEKEEKEHKEAKDHKKDDEDHCDYDDEDMEEMHKMYHSMGKKELELHKSSIEKCWMGKCGEMSKSETSSKEEPLAKTEELVKAEEANSLLKSELEATKAKIQAAEKEAADLKKSVNDLNAALKDFFDKKGPVRKSITSIDFVKKSEVEAPKAEAKDVSTLSKSEINSRLTKKAAESTLSKADRDAINGYCLENKGIDTVKHLLS